MFASGYEDGAICVSILTGGFGIEDDGGFVEVTGFMGTSWVADPAAMYGVVRPASDEWIREGEGEPIVGLFVSHPGSGGRVDPEMARVHYSLFNVPFQPLVVYDPDAGVLTVNARAPGTGLFNAVFRAVGKVPDAFSLNNDGRAGKSGLGLDAEE